MTLDAACVDNSHLTAEPRTRSFATGRDAWRRVADARRIGDLAIGGIVVVSYLLAQSDHGIQGDAHIYLGRALADLDPRGVGRDVMFLHDGQSSFSVFAIIARAAVAHLGLANAVRGLDLAAATVWLAAIVALVAMLQPGRAFATVAGAALLLPREYTPWGGLAAGEAVAVPRPFAEACVLLAFALLAKERYVGCGLLLCCATVLHPIMALPGIAVLLVALMAKDRRWAVALPVLSITAVGAAALGTPLLDRAVVVIDPDWLATLRDRSPYLFVTSWPTDADAMVLLQLATIAIASALVDRAWSIALRSAAAVAVLGCVLSAILCDGLHLLLFAQVQLWRSLWLNAALAPLAAGICVWRLPASGAKGRATLAVMAAAWACFKLQPMGALLALFAVALFANERLGATRAARLAICTVAAGIVLLAVAIDAAFAARGDIDSSPGTIAFVWHLTIWSFAVVALAMAGARWPSRGLAITSAALVLPALAVLLAVRYDDRSASKLDRDSGHIKLDLVALLAPRPGEVLWLGGDELWYWTRRANWTSSIQGAGIVFSPSLSRIWHDRTMALVAHGLASRNSLTPWAQGIVHRPLIYDRPQIDDLCRRDDAPAWVVMPIAAGEPIPHEADVRIWTPPPLGEQAPVRRLIVPCRAS